MQSKDTSATDSKSGKLLQFPEPAPGRISVAASVGDHSFHIEALEVETTAMQQSVGALAARLGELAPLSKTDAFVEVFADPPGEQTLFAVEPLAILEVVEFCLHLKLTAKPRPQSCGKEKHAK